MLYRFREAQEPGLGFGTRGDTQPRCGAWPARNSGLKLKRGKPVQSNTLQAKAATDASSSKSTTKPKSE
ncbi:hypothetical protein K438DRAFT_1873420 [Mycena galopus ATCC 62051]|nr:hypothetical protein K438DRAFT_1873420 [Mycena galopus ATCC 62051]